MTNRLDPLLQPRSIALVGASNNENRIGGMPLELMQRFQYQGRVFPINPKYEEVFGNKCYPDIESVPEIPDLVVLAIAAAEVTPMLVRCHAKGVRAAIVYASGFAEVEGTGEAMQQALTELAARTGMVIAGPNSMGFANLNQRSFTAFASVFRKHTPQEGKGRVSILTQSGNICSVLYGQLRELGVGVSQFINTGNEACLEYAEYLEHLVDDPDTDAVVGYVEQLRDGARFINAALEFSKRGKPLILFKAGKSEKGSEAIRSHTAAMAGQLAFYEAAFRQLNVIQADDMVQMADLAWLSGFRNRSGGSRVAVLTVSGAAGAIIADKLAAAGHSIPTLPPDVQIALRKGIPDFGMVANPVDLTGSVVNQPEFFKSICELLAVTDAVDTILLYAPGYLLDRMAPVLEEVCAKHSRLFIAIDTGAATVRERLGSKGVPVFSDLGRAMRALGPFLTWLNCRPSTRYWAALRGGTVGEKIPASRSADLNEFETKLLLSDLGLPRSDERSALNEDQAVAAADELGYPVAVKVLSADILHKTEVGGVRLNVNDREAVRTAFRHVTSEAKRAHPTARIDGALVQPMSSGVAEIIVGTTNDAVFGPAITVGLGGVLTELYRDVSHRLLPIDKQMALEMLREVKAFPLLEGFRGRPHADVGALCALMSSFSVASQRLAPAIQQAEINPLQVKGVGMGVSIIDAILLPAAAQSHSTAAKEIGKESVATEELR